MHFLWDLAHSLSHWLVQHEKLSGWAQFAGSLIALVIAIAIPAWQQWQKRKDDRFAKAEKIGVITEVVRAGIGAAYELLDCYERRINASGMSTFSVVLPRIERLVTEFARITIHELPTPTTVTIFIRTRHHMEDLYEHIAAAEEARIRDGLLITEISKDKLSEVIYYLKHDVSELEQEEVRIARNGTWSRISRALANVFRT